MLQIWKIFSLHKTKTFKIFNFIQIFHILIILQICKIIHILHPIPIVHQIFHIHFSCIRGQVISHISQIYQTHQLQLSQEKILILAPMERMQHKQIQFQTPKYHHIQLSKSWKILLSPMNQWKKLMANVLHGVLMMTSCLQVLSSQFPTIVLLVTPKVKRLSGNVSPTTLMKITNLVQQERIKL